MQNFIHLPLGTKLQPMGCNFVAPVFGFHSIKVVFKNFFLTLPLKNFSNLHLDSILNLLIFKKVKNNIEWFKPNGANKSLKNFYLCSAVDGGFPFKGGVKPS